MNRNLTIAASVVLFHIAALWALQSGLLRSAAEMIVPAEILVEIMAPQNSVPKVPSAQAEPAQAAPKTIAKVPPTVVPTPTPVATPAPTPLATAQPAPQPSPAAPASVASATAGAGSVSTNIATPASTAQALPRVELPSSDADYLHNPKPPYPPLSKRLGEQGRVIVRALIGVDGTATSAEIKQSSGFDRLDQAALATTLRWRYAPGKRAGVAEAMWFNLPFNFVLE